MGLIDRLKGGKPPRWAKGSPHDRASAEALLATLERYVVDGGGNISFGEEEATIQGTRGRRTYRLQEFVFICPADAPETWEKMIAVALRDVLTEPALVKEARAAAKSILDEHRAALDALADRETALAHLRLVLRVRGVRAELPDLLTTIARPVHERFEAFAVYDFLPADGIPAEHVARFHLDPELILQRAEENTFASTVEETVDVVRTLRGPFAGSRIAAPGRLEPKSEHGVLVAAPQRDLIHFHPIDRQVLEALDRFVSLIFMEHDGGKSGTGRTLFWWKDGVFLEIPALPKTIVREGQPPGEIRPPDRFRREVLKPLGL